MWPPNLPPSRTLPRLDMRHALAALLAGAGLLVAACGGGGGDGAASATAANYAQGAITGRGSIIVNGVRYDDSQATVVDDDDGPRGHAQLRLGVMVEVQSDRVRAASAAGELPTASASHIRMGSEIVGRVESPDGASPLVVLGQTVAITDTTMFDDSLAGGAAAIRNGDVLEIHAQFDAASGSYKATRVEPAPGATRFKLRGLVSALNTTAHTFQIGNAVINYQDVDPATLPNNLADGLRVRVRLKTEQVNGQWVATSVRAGVRRVEDHAEAHLRGRIGTLDSPTSFTVDGMAVDATGASFPDGTEGLAVGAAVEVEGRIANGVLVATKVELEDRHAGEGRHGIELHDSIAAIDTTNKLITLAKGDKVSYAGTVRYDRGSEATLAVGVRIEVRGVRAADGVTVQAVKIKFES